MPVQENDNRKRGNGTVASADAIRSAADAMWIRRSGSRTRAFAFRDGRAAAFARALRRPRTKPRGWYRLAAQIRRPEQDARSAALFPTLAHVLGPVVAGRSRGG